MQVLIQSLLQKNSTNFENHKQCDAFSILKNIFIRCDSNVYSFQTFCCFSITTTELFYVCQNVHLRKVNANIIKRQPQKSLHAT